MVTMYERMFLLPAPSVHTFEVPLRGAVATRLVMTSHEIDEADREWFPGNPSHEYGVFVDFPSSATRRILVTTDREVAYKAFCDEAALIYIRHVRDQVWDLDPRVPAEYPLRVFFDMITTQQPHDEAA